MSSLEDLRIHLVEGTAVPVEGNDIDTDRIIPARYLKEITFTNMGKYPFYDERFEVDGQLKGHAFDAPEYQGASILLVNQNFGCGSSREHAPQALMRWGIRAIVGESFAEIFAGNCTMLGVPVVTVGSQQIRQLMDRVKTQPATRLSLDLDKMEIRHGETAAGMRVEIPDTRRSALLHGTWNSTALLLANADKTAQVSKRLPYISGFAA